MGKAANMKRQAFTTLSLWETLCAEVAVRAAG